MPEAPAGGDLPRYETLFRLASGGMATVHVGTVRGAMGFRQIVAIKKPHAHLLDAAFRKAFVTEARLASLLHHANVVDVRDIEVRDDEVSLIMAYVEGASFGELLQISSTGGPKVTPAIAVRVVLDACAGLHAAHELADERGRPLHLVHRDISPQNLLVGTDGVTRVADFGIAKFKSTGGASTSVGTLKGKVAYMAPEYLMGEKIDRRFDVFAMGIVLWEGITGRRLFRAEHDADTMERVLNQDPPPVATFTPQVGSALDAVLEGALAKSPSARFENAAAMAAALEASARSAGLLAGHREVADLVQSAVGTKLEERRSLIRDRLANEPSVASVSFERPDSVDPSDLIATRKAKPLPNSNLGPSSPGPLAGGPAPSTVPDEGPPVHAPSTTIPDLAPRGLSPSDPGRPSPDVPGSGEAPLTPVILGGGQAGNAPIGQTTLPLAVAEALSRAKPRTSRMTPATLRSEAANLPKTKTKPENANENEKTLALEGAPGAPGKAASPEREIGDTTTPSPKKKRRFRPWPYVVAIVVGAVVGILVATNLGRKGSGAAASPSSTGAVSPSAR
jgi:serine/threonine protein kinase